MAWTLLVCESPQTAAYMRYSIDFGFSSCASGMRGERAKKIRENKKLAELNSFEDFNNFELQTVVSASHYRNQRKSCSWWIHALEKRAKNTRWLPNAHPYAHRTHIGTHWPLSDANHIPSHYFYVRTDAERRVSRTRTMHARDLFVRCVQIGNAIHYSATASDTSNEVDFDSLLLFLVPNLLFTTA